MSLAADHTPFARLDAAGGSDFGASWCFSGYRETVEAREHAQVLPALARVEQAAAAGYFAVGFIAYEAAAGLNPDLPALPPREGLPLLWFALFTERRAAADAAPAGETTAPLQLAPTISPSVYRENVARIRGYIAGGDCYQVNYTFCLEAPFAGDPAGLYRTVSQGQGAPFNAWLDTGRFSVISASPELFFSLKGGVIRTRPMKGTARRGRWLEEDAAQIAALTASAKERAENLMIVDLLRNDLGRIARTGSVRVESLFAVETYPTLHQMTSTVAAEVREGAGLAEILAALFPCGSVTGAPKRRSMEIIAELEAAPRGVYCGAVGYVAPGGEALFSVAIRTLLFDREKQTLSLGIGSGITTDSHPEQEYQECLTKSAFLCRGREEFSLLEALRLENGRYPLLAGHLQRLSASAAFFGFRFDQSGVVEALERHAAGGAGGGVQKVRLQLAESGEVALSSEPLHESAAPLRLALCGCSVDSADVFRYHKTTLRGVLAAGRAGRPDCDEVLFVNERGELTEGSYHNLLLKLDGEMLTPRRESGLLAGVMRQELLAGGGVAEATLFPADLYRAEELWLINSVRGRRRAVLV